MVTHYLVDLAKRAQWNLTDPQCLQVDDDTQVLDLAGHHHEAQEILHAKNEHSDESIDGLVLVPLLRYPSRADNDRGSRGIVATGEIHDAMLHVLHHAIVGDRPVSEVLLPPPLRGLHEGQSLLCIAPGAAQEACRHCRDGREELRALHLRQRTEGLQLLQLRFVELNVVVDLALGVTVLELADDVVRQRRVVQRLGGHSVCRHMLVPASDRRELRHRFEAVVANAREEARRHRSRRPTAP
mmetsp:Transcript_18063/g.51382  ORF Transcript_18063/g.51382 Transcript_18063/m.51382 type:complete len:241 (+) Transcript_18063:1059-1781(+)